MTYYHYTSVQTIPKDDGEILRSALHAFTKYALLREISRLGGQFYVCYVGLVLQQNKIVKNEFENMHVNDLFL